MIDRKRKMKERRDREIVESFSTVDDYAIDYRVCGKEPYTFLHVMICDPDSYEILAHWHPTTNSLRLGKDLGNARKVIGRFEKVDTVLSYLRTK